MGWRALFLGKDRDGGVEGRGCGRSFGRSFPWLFQTLGKRQVNLHFCTSEAILALLVGKWV